MAIAIMIGMFGMLVSCGDKGNGPDKKDPNKDNQNFTDTHYDDIFWDTTPIVFSMTLCSNNTELPSSCARYLAGNLDYLLKGETSDDIDDMIAERNAEAERVTKVDILYDYIEDDHERYGWGMNIKDMVDDMVDFVDGETPDIYCNFVYDMVAASLQKAFANLKTTKMSTNGKLGVNYFRFTDPKFVDSGEGYMIEYMKSLTLSRNKMYCLSSDYFTDMVRAFFVVPVNVSILNSIQPNLEVDNAYNSDRDGDGDFDIDDFYELVWDGEWSYRTLMDMSEGNVFVESGKTASGDDTTNGDLHDRLIFAISEGSGLSASGMLYTSSVTVIKREMEEKVDASGNKYDDYTYSYPASNDSEASDLFTFCDELADLFTNYKGVVSISNAETQGYAKDALAAIRSRFASNQILFGGCICLGSLEYDEYRQMNSGDGDGFGIVPVPLYRTHDENGAQEQYLTQIHNIGRIGAIRATTNKFGQCSAFLDYQSTYSTDILNEYYDFKLQYDIAGGGNNSDMLKYIRKNVRSSFDKAFEDAIGRMFATEAGGDESEGSSSEKQKWHALIMAEGFRLTGSMMMEKYETYIQTKVIRLKNLESSYAELPE